MQVGRLDIQIQGANAWFSGRLDEAANGFPEQVAAALPAGDTQIDLAGVAFVNSIGLRDWVQLIRYLRQRGTVTLWRIPERLMAQMNLLPELHGATYIGSFHAPYICPSCGAEAEPLIDAIANGPWLRQMQAPRVPCSECGSAMELAEFPERYLSVLGR
ncbi:MAG TPA: hypothetical protein VGM90_20575 [Kofleriaceae bacterium]|jgi:ABC-type transporter Mla MlaB component